MQFQSPVGLGSPHLQTIFSSVLRRPVLKRRLQAFRNLTREAVLTVDDVRIKVLYSDQSDTPDAPLIMVIPGWLGNADSTYAQSVAAKLYAEGFSVARINLRDHGGTVALNPGLFHSALTDEVVALVQQIRSGHGGPSGLLGFSLGGNFALRVARAIPDLPTLAVCPAIDPAHTMYQIDRNAIYQGYFVRKWHALWRAKQAAFPGLYDFSPARNLRSVGALTDYFVRYHTDFVNTDSYFAAYDLSGTALEGVTAKILVAEDDPIIPERHFRTLPTSLDIEYTRTGGHGAYLKNWQLDSWLDDYAVHFFNMLKQPSQQLL